MSTRINELIDEFYNFLNSKKVTLEEGFLVGQELILSSIEGFAETNNLHPEEAKEKLMAAIYGADAVQAAKPKQKPVQKTPMHIIGQERGWIGNPHAQSENN